MANVYTEALFCAAFSRLPGLGLDSLQQDEPPAAIRVAHAWAEGTDHDSLVKDVFSIKTGKIKIIASDKPVIVASREG